MALILGDDQKVALSIAELDDAGNAAAAPAAPPTWSVSDSTILSLDSVADDGMSAEVSAVGALGDAQVSVSDGTLVGTFDVSVVVTAAASLIVNAGTPEHK